MAGTTSGIEPLFLPFYKRKKKCSSPADRVDFTDVDGITYTEFAVTHPKLLEYFKINDIDHDTIEEVKLGYEQSPYFGSCAPDIVPMDRVAIQGILQQYITHSISSTINLPEDTDIQTVKDIYQLAWEHGLKGVTVYRDGSRGGILTSSEKKEEKLTTRPEVIPCSVKTFYNGTENWIAFIGELNGKPYEVFTGQNDINVFPIPNYVKNGKIYKVKVGMEPSRYDFEYMDNYGYPVVIRGLSQIFDKEYWNYARCISGMFREGIPVENVIAIIQNLKFDNNLLHSWQNGLIRCLKTYIKDGTKAKVKCINCGSDNVIYQDGCSICLDCGDSKCA